MWVCSLALPIAAAGILLKKYELVATALGSILLGHTIWTFDTLLMVFSSNLYQKAGLGIADYVNANGEVTFASAW